MRLWVRSLALLSKLRIWHCRELWCTLQRRLGSHVAVAIYGCGCGHGCGCDLGWQLQLRFAPKSGNSICYECGLKKTKKKKNVVNLTLDKHPENRVFLWSKIGVSSDNDNDL